MGKNDKDGAARFGSAGGSKSLFRRIGIRNAERHTLQHMLDLFATDTMLAALGPIAIIPIEPKKADRHETCYTFVYTNVPRAVA